MSAAADNAENSPGPQIDGPLEPLPTEPVASVELPVDALELPLEQPVTVSSGSRVQEKRESEDEHDRQRAKNPDEQPAPQETQRLPPELTRGGEVRYCRRCQEPLSFFATGPWNCWKCGLQFDPRKPRSYLVRRTLLKWKFWFPGFCLSVVAGVLTYGVFLTTRQIVLALIVSAPVCLGCLAGYGGNRGARWLSILLLWGTTALFTLLATADLCIGFISGVVLLVPALIGMAAGIVLRATLENSNWDQRWYFP